jgi:cation diffusion facilitator CzcD-associated flavoprotein CzcO
LRIFIVTDTSENFDAIIVGAGFSGLYQLYCLREKLNLRARVLEAGGGLGGTWYWNRYPGARCDSESHTYCYYFDQSLLEEWSWSERYPGQEEILKYLNFCAQKFDLERDINYNERVVDASWDSEAKLWRIKTQAEKTYCASFLITAVGCLSSANLPTIDGLKNFKGEVYHTGQWPHESVNFTNKSVVVVGTGSTGIQAIPEIAKQAKSVYVLQRTPNFSVPARNRPLSKEFHSKFVSQIDVWRSKMLESRHGHPWVAPNRQVRKTDPEERIRIMEAAWRRGGLGFRESFDDVLLDEDSNTIMSDFIRQKIRETVKDPETAEKLLPKDHPFGTKRPPIDTQYFETFNREHVHLIDLKENGISSCFSGGVLLSDGTKLFADMIVFATGFDAMTGALQKMNIRGKKGLRLKEAWHTGPQTYLGLAVPEFPNMFIITGPGSPSVLTNMPRAIEQNVDWITDLLSHVIQNDYAEIGVAQANAKEWTAHVTDVANKTLLPKANHSWYLGANVPGKPRVFMPYAFGLNHYRDHCASVAKNGYEGFVMTK